MTRREPPSRCEALVHPVMVCSVALLVVNDHWLKGRGPALLTGKLSDLAGAVVAVVLVGCMPGLLARACGRPRGPAQAVSRSHATGAALVVVGMAAIAKTTSGGAAMASALLGWVRWPLDVVSSAALAAPKPSQFAADPGDVLAVALGAGVALWVLSGHRRDLDTLAVEDVEPFDQLLQTSAGGALGQVHRDDVRVEVHGFDPAVLQEGSGQPGGR